MKCIAMTSLVAAALAAGCVPWANEDLTALRTGVQWHLVSAGGSRSCGLDGAGEAFCWGAPSLGTISPTDLCPVPPNPVDPVNDPGGDFPCAKRPIVVFGGRHYQTVSTQGAQGAIMAVDDAGAVWAWGSNAYGQRTTPGDTSQGEYPRRVDGTAAWQFATVTAGSTTVCGLTTDQKLVCWGEKNLVTAGTMASGYPCEPAQGQNGQCVAPAVIATPANPATGTTAAEVAVGLEHVCLRDSGGTVSCMGRNDGGEMGVTTGLATCPATGFPGLSVSCRLTFAPIAGTDKYSQIAAGGELTCGVTTQGVLKCWGRIYQTKWSVPTQFGLTAGWTSVSVDGSGSTVCAVRTDGTVWCFGYYALGFNTFTPTRVAVPGAAVSVTVGFNHACAWASDGTAWCWGENLFGELGDGTSSSTFTMTPVQVSAPYRD
jgi:alpha-tubulin suppressor-like RCC1 family protein